MSEPPHGYRLVLPTPKTEEERARANLAQEEAIRRFAYSYGITDLREFRGLMAVKQWDYYDVLKMVSP
jgi:hypothetical protein